MGECPTKLGFVERVLAREVATDLLDLGVHLCDGQGNNFTLELLEEFTRARLCIAAFVDCEGDNTARWSQLKSAMGDLLFQWPSGCTDANVVAHILDGQLEALLIDPDDTHIRNGQHWGA